MHRFSLVEHASYPASIRFVRKKRQDIDGLEQASIFLQAVNFGIKRLFPRDAQRDALANEVALGRLSCCCAFCEKGGVPPCRQQASAVTKMIPEAALYYTAACYNLVAHPVGRGRNVTGTEK